MFFRSVPAHSYGVSEAVIIDLDEVGSRPRADGVRPRRSPGRGRVVPVLAALALVFATVAAAAPGPRPLVPVTIPAAPGDLVFAAGDRYYVVHPGQRRLDAEERTVAAYRLPDAHLLWKRVLPTDRVGWLTGLASDTLLLTLAGPAAGRETVAVAAGSGRVWWRQGSQMLGMLPGREVLQWTSSSGDFGVGAGGETVTAVSLPSGTPRWSYKVPTGGWLWWDTEGVRPSGLVVMLPSGRVEIRDLGTGELTAAADLLPAREPAVPPDAVQLVADLLLVTTDQPGGTMAAYGRRHLDLRWTARLDLANEYVSGCGTVLCVGAHGGGLSVVDAVTGRTRWAYDRWSFAAAAGPSYLVAGPVLGAPGGTGLAVLDPLTGMVRADLGYWSLAWPVPADGRLTALRHGPLPGRGWIRRGAWRRCWVSSTASPTSAWPAPDIWCAAAAMARPACGGCRADSPRKDTVESCQHFRSSTSPACAAGPGRVWTGSPRTSNGPAATAVSST
jgi:outer membrane protein assembly factor BamB